MRMRSKDKNLAIDVLNFRIHEQTWIEVHLWASVHFERIVPLHTNPSKYTDFCFARGLAKETISHFGISQKRNSYILSLG